jgi:hypothetical protein
VTERAELQQLPECAERPVSGVRRELAAPVRQAVRPEPVAMEAPRVERLVPAAPQALALRPGRDFSPALPAPI